MKLLKKAVAVVLVLMLVITCFAGCSSKKADDGTYTYHSTTGSLNTWSPTDWDLDNESALIGYTSTPLFDFRLDTSTDKGYSIVPDLATELPEDVTAEYAGNETYGVPADATEGYAFKITLNDLATWQDGTAINTDTVEYSLKQFLAPEMKNYRASVYYEGSAALANAKDYYQSGQTIYKAIKSIGDLVADEDGYYTYKGKDVYFAWSAATEYLEGESLADYVDYGVSAIDENAETLDDEANGDGYVPLTRGSLDILSEIVTGDDWGETEEDLPNYIFYDNGKSDLYDWENVGFVKNDDHTFTIILGNPSSYFDFEYNYSVIYLLNEELYEANKKDTGGVTKSSYGTAVEKYSSYGPYKITTYQEGKQIYLEKNENWYGWTDGKHDDMYQTTAIDLQIIDEHTTVTSMFLQGKLDDLTLTSEDMEKYGTSDYVYFTPQSYTGAFAFNTDYKTLKSREEKNENKTILTYLDFRKAFSLAIDRQDYVKSCTSNYDAAYGLINDIYVYDTDTMEKYRDTDEAKQVLCDVYDVSDVEDLTGYNKEEASKLLQSAYDACLKDGNIDKDDVVTIEYHIYGSDSIYQKQVDYVQDAMDAAAKGTDLEGRIKFELVEDQDFYTSMMNGECDMIREAWGGADMDPYSIMECYTSPDVLTEYGYDNETECTINVNGEDVTMGMYEWYQELCTGTYATADKTVRNTILAGMEEKLLTNYHVIPVCSYTAAELYSQRIVLGTDTWQNSLVDFGGLQFMTYTMNDADWEAYCAEQNNQLTY